MGMACNVERQCSPQTSFGSTVRLRRVVMALSVLAVASIAFFYHRHNSYCEAYVYSMFCLSEYVAIALNMTFHLLGASIVWREDADVNDVNGNETKKGRYVVLKI